MLLPKIILRNQDTFEKAIENWSSKNNVNCEIFDGKESLFELADSLVIFHADHNISKENKELRSQMERHHKPTQEIDINGTMNASISSLKFWLENNAPKNILMVGDDKIVENSRFQDYFNEFGKQLKVK